MKKQLVKLTESDLHNIIKESVKSILSELDWRTYHRAALKDYDKNRAKKFAAMRDKLFNDQYEYSDNANGNHIRMQGDYNDPRLEVLSGKDKEQTHYIKHVGDNNYYYSKYYHTGYEKYPNPNGDKRFARKLTKAHDAFNSINNEYENGIGYKDNQQSTDFHRFLGKK